MAFNDDLSNFVHNYPYTNYHEVVLDFLEKLVAELKKIVDDADLEHINERLSAIDSALESDAAKIALLESASAAASDAINTLRGITSQQAADLESIHAAIDGVIDDLTSAVTVLEGQMSAISTRVDNLDESTNQRISQLERAAFTNLDLAPIPFTFIIDMRNGDSKGYKIVQDSTGLSSNSIVWAENKGGQQRPSSLPAKALLPSTFTLPMFKSSGNACHLVIPSIIPYKYNGGVDYTLYFYAQRWTSDIATSNSGLTYVLGISMNSLLTVGGVQQDTPSQQNMGFIDMELVTNTETGDYDLHLYNGRNGLYNAISDFTPTCIMVSTINIDPTRTGYFQRFSDLKHCAYNQIAAGLNPDGKIASALSESKSYTDTSVGNEATARNTAITNSENYITDMITPLPLSFTGDSTLEPSIVRNKSYYEVSYYNNTGLGTLTTTRKYYIELTVDIANLPHNTDVGLGTFTLPANLASNHNINCDIQKPNTGCYAQIASNGDVAIHCYNPSGESFGLSSRVHLMGVIIEQTVS